MLEANEGLENIFENAVKEAEKRRHEYVTIEHVLLSLVVIIHNSAGKTQSGVLFIWRNFIHLSHHCEFPNEKYGHVVKVLFDKNEFLHRQWRRRNTEVHGFQAS